MIVCQCNVLTDADILSTLAHEQPEKPRTAAQAYKCLGCAPDCGRCLATVRQILADARSSCSVGCATCPGHHAHQGEQHDFLIAAE
jgi:bacterioferritin-associated ferredoxin